MRASSGHEAQGRGAATKEERKGEGNEGNEAYPKGQSPTAR